MSKHVVILGGGLAGLSCGYEMAKAGLKVTVLEREAVVGGMANSFEEGDVRTAGQPGTDYWCYDYGPHRFHTGEQELIRHVDEILGENRVPAKRLSRIFMNGRFYNYPLNAGNILKNMSKFRILKILLDYAWTRFCDICRLRKYDDSNFKVWVEKRFGRTLAQMFFVEYTEKAWGIPATEISADWASQRITLLNLRDTIIKTLFKPGKKNTPRTLVTDFKYPRVGGIGELARGYKRRIEEMGGRVLVDSPAIKVHREEHTVTKIEFKHRGGKSEFITGDEYISTIPVTAMAKSVTPPPPEDVQAAVKGLDYVAIVFVYLKIKKEQVSPDNWVYLPQKNLTVHRISEFKNFSKCCAPPDQTMICAEITCRVGDKIWKADIDELREIATRDLAEVGLIEPSDVVDAFTKKIPFAYPIYDLEYRGHLEKILGFVRSLENIRSGGRQGLFRYNNMDQSIEMGRRMAASLAGEDVDHEAVATEQELFEYGDHDEPSKDPSADADNGSKGESGDDNDELGGIGARAS